jgi:hypothetical protein
MAQHDYNIADENGSSFLIDLNDSSAGLLAAIVSKNSGATEPTVKFAYMWWADTTTGILKMRNAANTAWISMFTIATGAWLGSAANADVATTATTATTATNLNIGNKANVSAGSGGSAILGPISVTAGDILFVQAESIAQNISSGGIGGVQIGFTVSSGTTLIGLNGLNYLTNEASQLTGYSPHMSVSGIVIIATTGTVTFTASPLGSMVSGSPGTATLLGYGFLRKQ